MKYIVCEEPYRFASKEKDPPRPAPGEVLLKIKKVGICGTDLHAYRGNQPFFTYPRILGHELAAEVMEKGEGVAGPQIRDRVAVMPYVSCGTCIACRHGKTNCCTQLAVLGVHTDGGMQEYFTIAADLLIPANDIPEEHIAVIEPLAIGAHAVRRADVLAGEHVVVVGAGPIGIGLMRFARLRGARVIAIDINTERLQYCKDILHAADFIVQAGQNAIQQVREITTGDLATAVFDATGAKRALDSGVEYLAHGGRYTLVGLLKGDLSFYHPYIHAREAAILCSRNATLEDFETVMTALRNNQFPAAHYITHRVHFTELIPTFESYLQPETGVIKAMVDWS